MAKSPPSFDLFPHDLIASTSHLTPEAFGAYMRLLCHQWMHGSIPRDARKIARIVGAFGEDELRDLMVEVLPFFDEIEGGKLAQARMARDRENAIDGYERRKAAADIHRECGKRGGRPKRASIDSINQIETILVSSSEPKQNQIGFENNQIGSDLGNQNETKTEPNAGRGKREEGILLEGSKSSEIENQKRNTKPPYPPSPDGKGEDGVSTSASPSQTKTKSSPKPERPKREPPFDPVQATAGEPWGDGLRRAWADWVSHQRERRSPLTPTTTRVLVEKLRDWGEARAVAAIKNSIANGWQGLIEPEPPKPATTAAQAPQPKPRKTRFPEPPPKKGDWYRGHIPWDEVKEYDRECAWNGYWSAKDRWEVQQALAKEKAEEEAEAARIASQKEHQGAA